MKCSTWVKSLLLACAILTVVGNVARAAEAPPKVAAALITKLIAFEKSLMAKDGDMTIHVIGSAKLVDALKKAIGKKLGKRTLGKVTTGDTLPSGKLDVLILADANMLTKVIAYTRKNKVLSITNDPEMVVGGISLGVGVGSDGKPTVAVNLASSKEEGLDWNPAILKIAKTVK